MKALVLLAVLCLSGAVRYPGGPVINFKPDNVYNYEYTLRITSGIPEMSDQHALMELNSDLVFKPVAPNTIVMQLRNVKLGRLNEDLSPYDEDIPVMYDRVPDYEKELRKPIKFVLNNGKIQSITMEASDEEWSVLMKKAIISRLEVTTADHTVRPEDNLMRYSQQFPIVFRKRETGVFGRCSAVYHMYSTPYPEFPYSDDVLNITKTWDYEDCEYSPELEYHNMDVQGAPWVCRKKSTMDYPGYETTNTYQAGCPYGFEPIHSPMKPYSHTRYNIAVEPSGHLMEEVFSEDKVTYKLYDRIIEILVHHNLTLNNITKNVQHVIPPFREPVTKQHLSHVEPTKPWSRSGVLTPFVPALGDIPVPPDVFVYGVFEPVDVPEVKRSVDILLDSLVDDIITRDSETARMAGHKSIHLVKGVAMLPRSALRDIWSDLPSLTQMRMAPEKEKMKRKLFLDAVSVCGSNSAALFIISLVSRRELTEIEAREVLEALPDNLVYPNKHIVSAYWKMVNSEVIMTRPLLFTASHLAFGKLLNEVVDNEEEEEMVYDPTAAYSKDEVPTDPEATWRREYDAARPRMNAEDEIHRRNQAQHRQDNNCQKVMPYIKELAKKLDVAKEFRQKVTYIEALAHTGCVEVLRYLEPYINGEVDYCTSLGGHSSISNCNFLRTVAIYSLHHVVYQWPKEVLLLVDPIYFNEEEAYDLRIAAFSVLLHCQPSLPLLEKIATMLWEEDNNQVVSYVYSALESMGNSSMPFHELVATRINEVFPKIKPLEPNVTTSAYLLDDYFDEDRFFGFQTIMEWVASNVSEHHRAGYLSLTGNLGPFINNMLEFGWNIKGLDHLIDKLCEASGPISDAMDFLCPETEPIGQDIRTRLEKLGIKTRKHEEFKATIFRKLFYNTEYHILEEDDILKYFQQVQAYLSQYMATSFNHSVSGHYVKLFMPASVHKVIAADYGIPAVHINEHPIILSVKLENVQFRREEDFFGVVAVIHPTVYHTSHAAAYVVSPIDGFNYGVAVDKIHMLSLPMEIGLTLDTEKDKYNFWVKPDMPQEIYYHKTQTSTFARDIPTIITTEDQFLMDDEAVRVIPVPYEYKWKAGHDLLGIGVTLNVESDDLWSDIPFWYKPIAYEEGVLAGLIEEFRNPGWTYREVKCFVDPDPKQLGKEYKIQVSYKHDTLMMKQMFMDEEGVVEKPFTKKDYPKIAIDEVQYKHRLQELFPEFDRPQWAAFPEELSQDWMKKARPSYRSHPINPMQYREEETDEETKWSRWPLYKRGFDYKKPTKEYEEARAWRPTEDRISLHHPWDTDERIKVHENLLKEHINTPLDLHDLHILIIPTEEKYPTFHAQATLRQSYDNKFNLLEIVKLDYNDYKKPREEICLKAMLKFFEEPTEFYLTPDASSPAALYGSIGWDRKCRSDSQMFFKGVLVEDRDVVKRILRVRDILPPYYESCMQDLKEGKSQSEDCEFAIYEDSLLNKMLLNVSYTELHPVLHQIAHEVEQAAMTYYYPNMRFDVDVANTPNTVSLEVEYVTRLPDVPITNAFLYKPDETISFERLYTPIFTPLSSIDYIWDTIREDYIEHVEEDTCNIMENYVSTFDDVLYQLPEDDCEYLIAKDCSEHETFAIIARQIDPRENTKVVEIHIAGDTVLLEPFAKQREEEVFVTLNGRRLRLVSEEVVAFNMSTPIFITVNHPEQQRLPPVVTVWADEYDIEVKYDGLNAKIEVPQRYRGETCGLCGDNNDEETEEFVGPNLCVYTDSTDFAHSYMLTSEKCNIPSRPQHHYYCPGESTSRYPSTYPKEPRRPTDTTPYQCLMIQTQVVPRGRELCFNTVPINMCSKVCRSTNMEEQRVGYHCLPDSPYARGLAKEADEGRFIHEVAEKKPDFYRMVLMPVSCFPQY